jgi:hypothetical protein
MQKVFSFLQRWKGQGTQGQTVNTAEQKTSAADNYINTIVNHSEEATVSQQLGYKQQLY